MDITILGIESSCDDTSAAVIRNNLLLSNVIASQAVHHKIRRRDPRTGFAGAPAEHHPGGRHGTPRGRAQPSGRSTPSPSRAAPGCWVRCSSASRSPRGWPGGARHPDGRGQPPAGAYPLALHRPARPRTARIPRFPFLCLLVSAAAIRRSYCVKDSPLDMEIIGTTIDDAAGEAFDKCAKVMGLPYPGGPVIDRLAKGGRPARRSASPHPRVDGLRLFSSQRAQNLVPLLPARRRCADDPDFIERNKADLCASLQSTIVDILLDKLVRGVETVRASATSPSPAAYRPTRDCANAIAAAGPQARLAYVPARVQVHDRQRRNDCHGRLLPLPARRFLVARRVARGTARRAVMRPGR